jgi:short-subunit dehydrogenase
MYVLLHSLRAELSLAGLSHASIGVVLVGLVATPIHKSAHSAQLERGALSSRECAEQIAGTVQRREAWAHVPWTNGLVLPLFQWLPENVRLAAVKREYLDLFPAFVERLRRLGERWTSI